jgi:predicted DNA-binding protein (MmcQ/YjbR family)
MTIENYHRFCLSLPNVIEDFPFDQKTMVMKVGTKEQSKMFALTNIDEFEFVNLKVKPEDSLKLQEQYDGAITPGYHMNKKHWVSVAMDESLPDEFVEGLIMDSYELVKKSLPKKMQEQMQDR